MQGWTTQAAEVCSRRAHQGRRTGLHQHLRPRGVLTYNANQCRRDSTIDRLDEAGHTTIAVRERQLCERGSEGQADAL